jgi:hypothetical protein
MFKIELCDSDLASLNMASCTVATSPFQRAASHLRFASGPARAIGLGSGSESTLDSGRLAVFSGA